VSRTLFLECEGRVPSHQGSSLSAIFSLLRSAGSCVKFTLRSFERAGCCESFCERGTLFATTPGWWSVVSEMALDFRQMGLSGLP
jgi:hypothetical protein